MPLEVRSHFPFDLKERKLSYDDIDSHTSESKQWTMSTDGKNRSTFFGKKLKGTDLYLYNVKYTVNEFNKRFVENQEQKLNPDHFVLSAGDSFTFGEGVEQGLDYPSQLASLLPNNFKVYNYGVAGDSANDFYLRGLADRAYFSPIQGPKGTFIWLYHEVQMQRLIFPTNAYERAPYIATKPDYTREDNGELKFHGFFNEAQRPVRKLVRALSRSAAVKELNIEVPRVFTEENFRLFFELLDQSIYVFETKYNKKVEKKILAISNSSKQTDLLINMARERGYQVLDIEKLLEHRRRTEALQVSIPVDDHPTSEAHWVLSRALLPLIGEKVK